MSYHAPNEIRQNIPALTGIRGLAAVLVMLLHIPYSGIFGIESKPIIIRKGGLGVELFFILSGFILMHVYATKFSSLSTAPIVNFYKSRVLRIYPLHLAVLFAIAAYAFLDPLFVQWFRSLPGKQDTFSTLGFFQTFFLLNRVGLPSLGEWNPPSWSLSAEMVGYAFFPVLALGASRTTSISKCAGVAFTSLAVYCVVYVTKGAPPPSIRLASCFVAGLFICRIYHLRPTWKSAPVLANAALLSSIVLLGIDDLAFLAVPTFALLILGLAYPNSVASNLCSSAPVVWLGQISFSLYIVHYMLQAILIFNFWDGSGETEHPAFVLFVLVFVPIVVAWLVYLYVERPSHHWGRRLAPHNKRVTGKLPEAI